MRRWLTFVLVSVILTTGCKVYDESLLSKQNCGGVVPNSRTGVDDGTDVGEVVFMLKEIIFEQRTTWPNIGYNLDGRCTTPTNGDVECQPIDRSALPEPDGTGGIDNVFGHSLFPLLSIGVPGLQEASQASQERATVVS